MVSGSGRCTPRNGPSNFPLLLYVQNRLSLVTRAGLLTSVPRGCPILARCRRQVEPDGVRYLYRPTTPRADAGASLLSHVIHTFFGGSAAEAMAALVGFPETRLSAAELGRLARIVEQARESEPAAVK